MFWNKKCSFDVERRSLKCENVQMSQDIIQKLIIKNDNFTKKQRKFSFIILNLTQKSVFFGEKKVLDHSSY